MKLGYMIISLGLFSLQKLSRKIRKTFLEIDKNVGSSTVVTS